MVDSSREEKFNADLNESAKAYADELFPSQKLKNQLLPDEKIHERLVEEYKELCSLKELNQDLESAIQIIFDEGEQLMEADVWSKAQEDFVNMCVRFETTELDLKKMTLGEHAGLSKETLQEIEKIAYTKYEKSAYEEAIPLYTFLTTFDEKNDLHWLRLGIIRQECGEMELAMRAYDIAIYVNPENIAAWVFSAECCHETGDLDQKNERIICAEQLIEESVESENWKEPVAMLKAA